MSKKLESVRLTYSQPKVYSLGSINQVQSYYRGRDLEGPNSPYWYS